MASIWLTACSLLVVADTGDALSRLPSQQYLTWHIIIIERSAPCLNFVVTFICSSCLMYYLHFQRSRGCLPPSTSSSISCCFPCARACQSEDNIDLTMPIDQWDGQTNWVTSCASHRQIGRHKNLHELIVISLYYLGWTCTSHNLSSRCAMLIWSSWQVFRYWAHPLLWEAGHGQWCLPYHCHQCLHPHGSHHDEYCIEILTTTSMIVGPNQSHFPTLRLNCKNNDTCW